MKPPFAKPNHLLAAVNLAAEARDIMERVASPTPIERELGARPPPKHLVDAIERLADAVRYLAAEIEAQSKVACKACAPGEYFPSPPPHTCARVSP